MSDHPKPRTHVERRLAALPHRKTIERVCHRDQSLESGRGAAAEA